MEQEHQEALKQIAEDTVLTADEKEARIAEINAQYFELREALLESHNSAIVWLDETAATDRAEAWTESYENTIQDQEEYKNNTEDLSEQLKELIRDTQATYDFYEKEAELDNKNLENSIKKVTDTVKALKKSVTDKGGLADAMDTAMQEARNLTSEFYNQYDALTNLISKYQTAADEANAMYQQVLNLTRAQRDYNAAVAAASNANYSGSGGGNYGSSGSGNNNGSSSNGIEKKEDTGNVVKKRGTYKWITWDYNGSRYRPSVVWEDTKGKTHTDALPFTTLDPYFDQVKNQNAYKKFRDYLNGYKTGGYTGSWNGPNIEENGKLAFLHQKELVLNANDTENMLNAVKLIRQISQTIDLQAAAQSSTSIIRPSQLFNEREALQQEVTIHAEFPNVSDHNEIEEAFDNLVNRASQYANRWS